MLVTDTKINLFIDIVIATLSGGTMIDCHLLPLLHSSFLTPTFPVTYLCAFLHKLSLLYFILLYPHASDIYISFG